MALILLEKNLFNDSIQSFQNLKVLVSFSNYLIHYKPDWLEMNSLDNTRTQIIKLEKSLKGKYRLDISLTDIDSFPICYLNASCSYWGIKNCIKFVKEFYNKVDTNYLYSSIIQDLADYYKIK